VKLKHQTLIPSDSPSLRHRGQSREEYRSISSTSVCLHECRRDPVCLEYTG